MTNNSENGILSGVLFKSRLENEMENISVLFLLFFAQAVVASAVIGYASYWVIKRSIANAYFAYFTPTLLLVNLVFLFPYVGIVLAVLAVAGILLVVCVLYWLVHECSPQIQARIQREHEAFHEADPPSPVFKRRAGGQ